jgi:hypothetical protein
MNPHWCRLVMASLATAALGLACSSGPRTPEEKKARGDELLRQMSQTLAAGKVFSFTAEEQSDTVRPGGQKSQVRRVRHVVVRRPDGFSVKTEGEGPSFWYDGQRATFVNPDKKRWARARVPPTLDEMLDYVAAVYDLRLPWADLMYSSPYDALVTADTTGGWVGKETIGGTECDHLSYQHPVVDWQIWLGPQAGVRQLQITYKQDPGQPVTRVVFKDLNLSPPVDDRTFTATVPEGFERIRVARRDSDLAPVETAQADPPPAASATPTPPAR